MFSISRAFVLALGPVLMVLSLQATAGPIGGNPYDPPEGTDPSPTPPPAAAATRITAATYNLHGGRSAADVPDVPALAEAIYRDLRGQDVLVLTEADTSLQALRNATGPRNPVPLSVLYPNVLTVPGSDVVLLSKLPILRSWTLSTQSNTFGPPYLGRWPAMVTVGAEFYTARNERFIVYGVHLRHDSSTVNRGYDRVAQLQAIRTDLAPRNPSNWPVVVMGDLNDTPNDTSIAGFRQLSGLASPLQATWTNYDPATLHAAGGIIDYAFVTPGTVMYQWLQDVLPGASDHGNAMLVWENNPGGNMGSPVNIAKGRPATATSTLEGYSATPGKAVDGDKTPVYTWAGFQATGFHSGHADATQGKAPVWQVDLGGTKAIGRIALTNRWPDEYGNAGPAWMTGWHAEVLDAQGRTVWRSANQGLAGYPTVINAGGVMGSKVAIVGRAGGYINFAEVEVTTAKRPVAMDTSRGWAHSVLPPTTVAAMVDGDPDTWWSSVPIDTFNRQEFDVFPKTSSVIASLRLQARMVNGVPRGVPKSFNLLVLDSPETSWLDLGRFSPTVDSSGAAWVNLPDRVATKGVKIRAFEQSGSFEEIAEVELFSEPHVFPAP